VSLPAVLGTGPDSIIWWGWVRDHGDQVRHRVWEHLQLTGMAVGIGFAVSLALALLALRYRWTYAPITWVTGLLYTIPSLALFAFLLPITGFTTTTSEIGLVSYTLLILVRNIVAGVDGVPASVREAADAMGYRPWRRFFAIDLRLATPAIVAGLRIASVTTVGLVTITALIGQGGLGYFINDGLQRRFSTPIVLGTGLSVLLAIAIDVVLLAVQWAITPWARARRPR
jgi:osmoprotectant transport system permease protein